MTHRKRETHRFDHARFDRLLDPSRFGGIEPGEILRRVGAAPGMVIVDFGCGPGYFTAAAAEIAGAAEKIPVSSTPSRRVTQGGTRAERIQGHEGRDLSRNQDGRRRDGSSRRPAARSGVSTHGSPSPGAGLTPARSAG